MTLITDLELQCVIDLATRINTQIGSAGVIRFYDGTPPANVNLSPTGSTIVDCALSASALITPTTPDLTFDTITDGTAGAPGTVTYARILDSSENAVMQFSVAESSAEITIDNATFATFDVCSVTELIVGVSFA